VTFSEEKPGRLKGSVYPEACRGFLCRKASVSSDKSHKAPFIIVGAVNLLVMLGGMWLQAREMKESGKIAA
jgi:hypothetical protein